MEHPKPIQDHSWGLQPFPAHHMFRIIPKSREPVLAWSGITTRKVKATEQRKKITCWIRRPGNGSGNPGWKNDSYSPNSIKKPKTRSHSQGIVPTIPVGEDFPSFWGPSSHSQHDPGWDGDKEPVECAQDQRLPQLFPSKHLGSSQKKASSHPCLLFESPTQFFRFLQFFQLFFWFFPIPNHAVFPKPTRFCLRKWG